MDMTSLDLMMVSNHRDETRVQRPLIWPLVADLLLMVPGLLLVGLGAATLTLGLQMAGVL